MAQQILTKQDKPKILEYFPTKQYGQNGDIVISRIRGKGIFFCIKVGGAWYAQTTMQPLNKINDEEKSLLEGNILTNQTNTPKGFAESRSK